MKFSVEFPNQSIVDGVLLIAGLGLLLSPFQLAGGNDRFVRYHGVETKVRPKATEEFEYLITNFRKIIIGVKPMGGFRALGSEGLDTGEIGIS